MGTQNKNSTPRKKPKKKGKYVTSSKKTLQETEIVFQGKSVVDNHHLQELQKKDPAIVRIKAIGGSVMLYRYQNNEWEAVTRGPMFICQRNKTPVYKAVIYDQMKGDDKMLTLQNIKIGKSGNIINIKLDENVFGLWTSDEREEQVLMDTLTEIRDDTAEMLSSTSGNDSESLIESISVLETSNESRKIDLEQLFPKNAPNRFLSYPLPIYPPVYHPMRGGLVSGMPTRPIHPLPHFPQQSFAGHYMYNPPLRMPSMPLNNVMRPPTYPSMPSMQTPLSRPPYLPHFIHQ